MNQLELNNLFSTAIAANQYATKSAAAGVGGQQVIPMAPYQNASGLYDPDPSMAGYTALSEARAQINAQSTLDGMPNNLLPYQQVLNTNYQTIASSMQGMQPGPHSMGMGGQKSASQYEVNNHFQKMASSGLFPNNQVLPNMEGWGMIEQVALQKAASDTEAEIAAMIQSGVLQQVRPDFIPIFTA